MTKTSEVYKKVFHYTTLEGAVGILKSQSLWSTHCRFLNDFSEIILFKDRLFEFLFPVLLPKYSELYRDNAEARDLFDKNGGLEAVTRHDVGQFIDASYKALGEEVYITSFCGEHRDDYVNANGLLSQWRAYGRGGGISIMFDTAKIEDHLKAEAKRYNYGPGFIGDVVYSDDHDRFRSDLAEKIQKICGSLLNFHDTVMGRDSSFLESDGALQAFFQCIARYKHRAFKEENEVRIASQPMSHTSEYLAFVTQEGEEVLPEKERKFRIRNGEQVPYIELFLNFEVGLPIEKIVVGPHKEKASRAAFFRTMLRKTSIEVVVSDIPYLE